MSQVKQIREKILEMVKAAKSQRLSPLEVIRHLSTEFGVSMFMVRGVLNDLIRERKLVFTYRDPCTYVEIPCQDWPSRSRPMKVLVDDQGDPWICDCDVDPSKDLAQQGCWQVKEEESIRTE
jgi:hypothetical protein